MAPIEAEVPDVAAQAQIQVLVAVDRGALLGQLRTLVIRGHDTQMDLPGVPVRNISFGANQLTGVRSLSLASGEPSAPQDLLKINEIPTSRERRLKKKKFTVYYTTTQRNLMK